MNGQRPQFFQKKRPPLLTPAFSELLALLHYENLPLLVFILSSLLVLLYHAQAGTSIDIMNKKEQVFSVI